MVSTQPSVASANAVASRARSHDRDFVTPLAPLTLRRGKTSAHWLRNCGAELILSTIEILGLRRRLASPRVTECAGLGMTRLRMAGKTSSLTESCRQCYHSRVPVMGAAGGQMCVRQLGSFPRLSVERIQGCSRGSFFLGAVQSASSASYSTSAP